MANEENLVTENVATPITETKPPTVLEKPKKKPKAVKEHKEPETVKYTHFEDRKLSIDAETADEDYFARNGQR